MKVASILVALAASALAGCATRAPQPPAEMQTKFVRADHDPYMQPGTGTITGQGFLRQKGGGVVTCAGSPVYMVPITPYFRELLTHLLKGRQVGGGERPDPAYSSLLKQTSCDAQGNFSFTNLPSGAWAVTTDVKWMAGNSQQGGSLLGRVTSTNGQSTQVLLSDAEFIGR